MVTRAKVTKNRNVPGEWIVRVDVDGKRYPAGDYFTDDREDAEQTAQAMLAAFAEQTVIFA